MKAKVQTILMLALLLALTVFPIVLAQDTIEGDVVGVKAGDWVKYKVTRLGTHRAWIYENVAWIKVEVLNVSGTTVTTRETLHYDDGSKWVINSSYNLQGDMYALCRYVIAANLGPGDKVGEYPLWMGGDPHNYVCVDLVLNDTDYRTYGGVTSEVNQLKYSRLLKDAFVPGLVINRTIEKYWDKHTGFTLELKVQTYSIGYKEYYKTHPSSTYKMEIVDTNMWEMEKPPQQTPWWLAAIPVGAVIIAAVAVKVRNNRKKNEDDTQ